MMKFSKWIYIVLVALVAIPSCTSTTKLSSTNLASIYNWSDEKFNPQYIVYHDNDSSSSLYFRFNSEELTYRMTDATKPAEAKIKINYTLYDSFESEIIKDSLTSYLIENSSANDPNYITGRIDIKVKRDQRYVLRIITADIYGGKESEQFINVTKLDLLTRQNYLVTDTSGTPIFGSYINQSQEVLVHFNHIRFKELEIRGYNREFKLAPPPFATYTPKPFLYEAENISYAKLTNGIAKITMPANGFIHLIADKDSRKGITLYTYPEHFPAFGTNERMIEPLRYITSKKEYQELTENPELKRALDQFWIENATNPERAKELIKHFYNRIEYANIYFSSFDEGWRTDRGMAYLIFGPPNAIYKTSSAESWVYGEDNNYMSVNFVFSKVINPFSDNDYRLNRSSIYKSHWYRAVDSWRQGRVFLNN
ncbi:MAG: GWxTD domain-containing protein [Flavobacteriales bacterium]|nr:GWxTD domain-containing protein [Flavobacteriales bacterium]